VELVSWDTCNVLQLRCSIIMVHYFDPNIFTLVDNALCPV